jgi:hypothetical protein
MTCVSLLRRLAWGSARQGLAAGKTAIRVPEAKKLLMWLDLTGISHNSIGCFGPNGKSVLTTLTNVPFTPTDRFETSRWL